MLERIVLFLMVIVLVVSTSSCGRLGDIQHEGNITTTITVDTALLDSYFLRSCCKTRLLTVTPPSQVVTDLDIAACAKDPLAEDVACAQNTTAEFLTSVAHYMK